VERGGRDGAISFNGFLDYLESIDEEDCDPHWQRQSYIFGERRMDAFVRLESLTEDFARIAPRVGGAHLAVFDAKRQSNRYDRDAWAAAMDFDMPDRSSHEVMAWVDRHGAFPPKEAFLTEAVRARIRRLYAQDFEALPYAGRPPRLSAGSSWRRATTAALRRERPRAGPDRGRGPGSCRSPRRRGRR
jgi:hypothetical protein